MTPASIPDPTNPRNIGIYAEKNNFSLFEFTGHTNFSEELAEIIWTCLVKAQQRGCVEFAITSIRDVYDIFYDRHSWSVTIFGFLKTDGGKL